MDINEEPAIGPQPRPQTAEAVSTVRSALRVLASSPAQVKTRASSWANTRPKLVQTRSCYSGLLSSDRRCTSFISSKQIAFLIH
eukprot:2566481-Pyramimonas_sp.AAC.1